MREVPGPEGLDEQVLGGQEMSVYVRSLAKLSWVLHEKPANTPGKWANERGGMAARGHPVHRTWLAWSLF